ncbi:response regulator transcription factor [Pinisolibacter sp.]|uniref:response regulator transcription factor n=1 Tax=Pinisolibacter sp. TaxID=2172024 RepID=UPI002FDD4631
MTTDARIAVVDDDPHTRETVADYLALHDFDVVALDGGTALRAEMAERAPDLVVLDLHMPGENGLSVLRWLKEEMGGVPVIMLTSTASPIDRVVGLELGADDYLAKPAELRELVARIRSVLRRVAAPPPPASPPAVAKPKRAAPSVPRAEPVVFGDRLLDRASRRLVDRVTGAETVLHTSEFQLLEAFVDHPNRVLSREQLLDLAHARDPEAFDRAIDVRIARIRKKIEPDPSEPTFIRTVRGAGYIYVPGRRERGTGGEG